jgi:hypothetical protein
MKTLSELIAEGYTGTDANVGTSLYEYGLLCKEEENGRIHCYYGVGSGRSGLTYELFCSGGITKREIDSVINEGWFHKLSFFQFLGQEEKNWLVCANYISKISDLLCYYGFENIFGTTYEKPFEIFNE